MLWDCKGLQQKCVAFSLRDPILYPFRKYSRLICNQIRFLNDLTIAVIEIHFTWFTRWKWLSAWWRTDDILHVSIVQLNAQWIRHHHNWNFKVTWELLTYCFHWNVLQCFTMPLHSKLADRLWGKLIMGQCNTSITVLQFLKRSVYYSS